MSDVQPRPLRRLLATILLFAATTCGASMAAAQTQRALLEPTERQIVNWSAQLVSAERGAETSNTDPNVRNRVRIVLNLKNISPLAISARDAFRVTVNADGGLTHTTDNYRLVSTGLIPPGGSTQLTAIFTIDPARQSALKSTSVVEMRRDIIGGRTRGDLGSVEISLPPVGPPPVVAPAPALADRPAMTLKAFEGRYTTNRGTILTFAAQGDELVGTAMSITRPRPREEIKLTLREDGSLRGTMRDDTGVGRYVWFDLEIRFTPNGASFAGQARYTHGTANPPEAYSGERMSGGAALAGGGSTPASGFTRTDYLDLRLDAVARKGDGPVEVYLTVRSAAGERRSIQHDPHRYVLIGSNGAEYRTDGNWYGTSGTDHLQHTVWMIKDEQASATHVFYGMPRNVTPARLVVRNGDVQVASFDLAGAPSRRGSGSTPGGAGGADVPAGQPVSLEGLEVSLISIGRGNDGDWETVVTVKNTADQARPLLTTDLIVSLYDGRGETRHAMGNFYDSDRSDRALIQSGAILQPGERVRLRLWHAQSGRMTPTRYGVRGRDGPTTTGDVSPLLPKGPEN